MRRSVLLAFLLLNAPALVAQDMGFIPGPGFQPTATSAAAYTCTSADQVSTGGRCASTAIPGNLTAATTPQFLVIGFDDCITPESEGLVRSVLTPTLKNPDGRPVPSTYFLSLEGCPGDGSNTDPNLVKQRYNAGDEIAVHTRTHTTGTSTSLATWITEMNYVRTYLRNLGLGADAGVGFRAPFLQTNAAMYTALDSLNFLYDSSIYESPFWSPISTSTQSFIWPFTYDTWNNAQAAQNCAGWSTDNPCPSKPVKGLWQMPLYYYVKGTQSNATYYGVFDIGDPATSGYSQVITGNVLKNIYQDHFNARIAGNRAPMTLYFHAYNFGNTTRAANYRDWMASVLSRGDVWAVTQQGLIEWMRAPVPNSQMKQWYASYCLRHKCAPGTTTAAEDDVRLAAADVATPSLHTYPSPSRGPVTLTAIAQHPGATLAVFNVLGREVYRADVPVANTFRTTLDLSREAAGVYFARFTDGTRTTTQPVIVQH